MLGEKFTAVLLEGHKGAAVEVPFDPATRWGRAVVRLEPGRFGHYVNGRLNGEQFESVVVPRARGFYLLISPEQQAAAHLAIGDVVQVILHPRPQPGVKPEGRERRPRARRRTPSSPEP
jgi:uncharacterized protein DUF1905